MKRALLLAAVLVLGLAAVILVKAAMLPSEQVAATPVPPLSLDRETIAERLARTVRFPTISGEGFRSEPFLELHRFLESTYPRVWESLSPTALHDRSLLFEWPGTDPALDPVLLLAHQDVVPVDPGSSGEWTHPPFSGEIAGGYIWGRGTLDIKIGMIGILEAVDHLLAEGFSPRRTVFIAFGHDEETGGRGAAGIARLLEENGTRLEAVLDEGLALTEGVIPGVDRPVALVGLAEKGYLSLEFAVSTEGGHSSMPPSRTAIGVLAGVVESLDRDPLPSRLDGPTRMLFETLAPEMSWGMRALMSNLWLFGPLVKHQLEKKPSTAAAIRTTSAVTIFQAGVQDNVLPARARAVANFRIRPGDSVDGVEARFRNRFRAAGVEVTPLPGARNPSPVSDAASEPYRLLARSIREVFPQAVVAPGLVLGGTDSRSFTGIAREVYRFVPIRVGPDDLGRIHGTDERISVENAAEVVRFYDRLIRNWAGPKVIVPANDFLPGEK